MGRVKTKLHYISFLKGIAIFGVFWVHCPQCFGLSNYFTMFFWPGQFGCQLFFLISGFLAINSWQKLEKTHESYWQCTLTFYLNKWKSIFPIYMLAIIFWQIIGIILNVLFGTDSFYYRISHDWDSILLNILLLNFLDVINNNNIVPGGWFIGTIILFYILFPLLNCIYKWMVSKNNNLFIIPIIALLLSFGIQYYLYHITGNWNLSKRSGFVYFSIINQFTPLLLGMIANYYSKVVNLSRNSMLIGFVSIMMISLILFYLIRINYWINIFIPFLVSLSFYYLFFYVKKLYSIHKEISRYKIIRYFENLGDISFAIYFSNFIGTFLFSWIVIHFIDMWFNLNHYIVFLILLIPMYYLTICIGNFINKIINWFSLNIDFYNYRK